MAYEYIRREEQNKRIEELERKVDKLYSLLPNRTKTRLARETQEQKNKEDIVGVLVVVFMVSCIVLGIFVAFKITGRD